MKKPVTLLILLAGLGALAWAQETTTVQVAPSTQVIYPDASQILNKTVPAAPAPAAPATPSAPAPTAASVPPAPGALPSNRPVTGTTPVPAASVKAVAALPAVPAPGAPAHGWFLLWTLAGGEAEVQAWAAALGRPVTVAAVGEGRWEVLAGPLDAQALGQVLAGQGGQAVLVRR